MLSTNSFREMGWCHLNHARLCPKKGNMGTLVQGSAAVAGARSLHRKGMSLDDSSAAIAAASAAAGTLLSWFE